MTSYAQFNAFASMAQIYMGSHMKLIEDTCALLGVTDGDKIKEIQGALLDPVLDKIKKMKPTRDANEPRKPLTSYMLFQSDYRLVNQEKLAGVGLGDVAKQIGAAWHALHETDKGLYAERAAKEKERYEEELREYKNRNVQQLTNMPDSSDTDGM